MASQPQLQYISDSEGKHTGVIVPIDAWRAIEADSATAYLLSSPRMAQRIDEALSRSDGIPLEQVRAQLDL